MICLDFLHVLFCSCLTLRHSLLMILQRYHRMTLVLWPADTLSCCPALRDWIEAQHPEYTVNTWEIISISDGIRCMLQFYNVPYVYHSKNKQNVDNCLASRDGTGTAQEKNWHTHVSSWLMFCRSSTTAIFVYPVTQSTIVGAFALPFKYIKYTHCNPKNAYNWQFCLRKGANQVFCSKCGSSPNPKAKEGSYPP